MSKIEKLTTHLFLINNRAVRIENGIPRSLDEAPLSETELHALYDFITALKSNLRIQSTITTHPP
jgi:hypothetical protein